MAGKTDKQIAEEEGLTRNGVFLATKRLQPPLLTALRRADYDLAKAVRKMVEFADAEQTQYFAHNGVVTDQREVRDNATCLKARTQLLRLHGVLGTEFNSQPQSSQSVPNVMVIIGADDTRINRLKAQTITVTSSSVEMQDTSDQQRFDSVEISEDEQPSE